MEDESEGEGEGEGEGERKSRGNEARVRIGLWICDDKENYTGRTVSVSTSSS